MGDDDGYIFQKDQNINSTRVQRESSGYSVAVSLWTLDKLKREMVLTCY